MKILVTGGTGFVGTSLVQALVARGDQVTVVSRKGGAPGTIAWSSLESAVAESDAVIHLAGKGLGEKRWTDAHLDECWKSRVETTEAIARAISQAPTPPRVWISASAVGYYGTACGTAKLVESAHNPPGADILARMCVAWEKATELPSSSGERAPTRIAHARLGIVLDADGGALQQMLTPFRLGLGGPLGDGRQPFPWIHRRDTVRAILHALDTETLRGPFHVVAPGGVTMGEFAKALGRALHRPALFRVPGAALRLAVGGFAEAMLSGQWCVPEVLEQTGFDFEFPTLEKAFEEIFTRRH